MQNSVGNLFDYIAWRGDLSFKQSEFNAVDGLILVNFSFIRFKNPENFIGKTLSQAINGIKDVPVKEKIMIVGLVQETTYKFLEEAVKSKRFKDLKILDYIEEYNEESTKQFAAISFKLPDNTIYIAFRGTDDSLIGWKEDFNMAFINGVPSQIAAAKYAQQIYDKYELPIRLGGHSKGGNLAIWAGANLSSNAKEKLLKILNYDGPGFLDEFIESDGYKAVVDKIISYIPESSIVGILMGHCDYLVIKSSSHLIFQHDTLSWNIIGKRFDFATERSQAGKKMDVMINNIIKDMDKTQVSELVDKIFEVVAETNAKTLDDLKSKKMNLLKAIAKQINVESIFKSIWTSK